MEIYIARLQKSAQHALQKPCTNENINKKGQHNTSNKTCSDYNNIQIHAFKQLSLHIVHT